LKEKQTITIGEQLKKLRKKQNLSQEDLAFYSKLDRKYISKLERNISRPTLVPIFKLAVALGMKPSEFIRVIEETEENVTYLLEASKEVEESKSLQKKNNIKPKDA
jgi:transcriptional regulator with XRE-family HTH domain